MYYFDPTYILVLIGAVLSMIASWNVNSNFRKYSQVFNRNEYTAEDVAALILRDAGITDVQISHIRGNLTDHYAPNEKTLRLSDSVYGSTSVAAIGVAAHECGHAVQHKVGYRPLVLRSAAVPIANIGSRLSWPVLLLGLILGSTGLARAGVILFCFVVFFQLITLPVEFDASNRALKILQSDGILYEDEMKGASAVLHAAALTYVAALASTVLQLLRLILLVQRSDRNN